MSLAAAVALLSVVSALPPFKTLESKPDRFSVDLPGKPRVDKDKSITTYTVGTYDGAVLVMVMKDPEYDNLTPDALKAGFDAFRESLTDDAKLTSEQPLSQGGIPGLEVKASGKDEDSVGRMFLGQGRSWTLLCMFTQGKHPEDVGCDRALSSFKLLDGRGAPLASTPAPAPAAAPPPAAGQAGPPVLSIAGATLNMTAEGSTFLVEYEASATVTRAPAGASLRVDAKCKLGKKNKTFTQLMPITAQRGETVFKTLFKLPSKPESCELVYFVVVNGKPVMPENGPQSRVLDVACWPVQGEVFPGPCDQP